MGAPYVGEIKMFGGNFAPLGWSFCNGAIIPISENETLFNLIGTTYGGDGQTTFQLPNLQSRFPMHVGPGFALSQTGGVETVTLTTSQIPAHSHVPQASNTGGSDSPNGTVWAKSTTGKPYANAGAGPVSFNNTTIQPSGGSQPHDNMHPFLVVNFIISLFGVFPTQN